METLKGITVIGVLSLAVVLVFPPAMKYTGEYTDYWWGPNETHQVDMNTINYGNYGGAMEDCESRTEKYFAAYQVIASTVDTSTTTMPYETYECYGAKLNKIP